MKYVIESFDMHAQDLAVRKRSKMLTSKLGLLTKNLKC
jgi:hypothetical protein